MDNVEVIRNRMLSLIPSDLDKSEGSFIYDVLSTVAIEIARNNIELDNDLQQTFVGAAVGENLDKRTLERGITRLPASRAIGQVEFTGSPGAIIQAGTLVSTENSTQYQTNEIVTIESSGKGIVSITAVVSGLTGNVPSNLIKFLPITIAGVTSVNNPEPTYGGENEETDVVLRERYFRTINNQAIDGNVAQYRMWAEEYPGIGRVKVFPLWNGANTLKLSILSTENQVATLGLIQDFQNYIDPNSTGLGNGVAPIGSIVTVSTATPVTVNISADLVLSDGYTEPTGINEALTQYLSELAYIKNTVSYIGIGATILLVPSIDQVKNLLINEAIADITLGSEQIPVIGSITWTVMP